MNWIHVIDVIFFILLPVGFMAYAIRYAWEDCKTVTSTEHKWYRGEDDWFYCQNCGKDIEDMENTCSYHYRTITLTDEETLCPLKKS